MERQELVRRLLGVATDLFINDKDPFSVYCLASTAGEHAAELARQTSGETFNDQILKTFPEKSIRYIRQLRNRDWNAIKHARHLDGSLRLPEKELADFSDIANDHMLFIVWYDYASARLPLPIAVQVFQVWYFEMYPEAQEPEVDKTEIFGSLSALSRSGCKEKLRKKIIKYSTDETLLAHDKTDQRPLVL
ncbi:hypothetical protein [Roseovarius aestuariivivens]|uniref:hypothetical protein n=1 Tax=Roseovarius aestuariivivens TaxID=1888910 RepID=UPI001080717F|nr:hypothetical protein [Roseovarius aestuariivivens]